MKLVISEEEESEEEALAKDENNEKSRSKMEINCAGDSVSSAVVDKEAIHLKEENDKELEKAQYVSRISQSN